MKFGLRSLGLLALLSLGVQSPVLADLAPHALCPGGTAANFTQTWTNTGLITTFDDWSGVPSIIGYMGNDNAISAADINPTTVTTDAVYSVDVIQNLTASNIGVTSGGVAEFEIANPVVALQGSGTADFPNIVVTLNSAGTIGTTLAYTVRDIDSTIDNSVQQFNIQYRTGTSGTWINVPGSYIADASVGPSLTQNLPIAAFSLPAGFNNAAAVQIRFMTTNATGNDEWLGIDDIVVAPTCGTPDPCATITFPYTLPNNARNTLVAAMECANANGASADIIDLNGFTVALLAASPYASYQAPTGLPRITTNITLRDGTIEHDLSGGGFLFRTFDIAAAGTLNLVNMTLLGDSAPTPGGAFYNLGALNVTNSTMTGYDTNNRGGVLFNGSGSTANFTNALFYDNNAVNAHVMDNLGSVTIINSTFDKHTSISNFGAILEGTGYVVRNSILWNPGSGPIQISSGNTVSDSIVKGGYSGGTNILNTNPLFVNEAGNDFRLQLTSPAINVGVNAQVPLDSTDVDGDSNTTEVRPDRDLNPRIIAGVVDLGAYENQDAGPPDPCVSISFPYTVPNNTPATLIQAIQCANANGTADVIDLNGQTVTLTDTFASYSGATGLPQITTALTLRNGTLTRGGSNLFRILSVSAAGNLSLRNVTVSNGGGSGYASLGAGLHNLGTAQVIGSSLSNNSGNQAVAIYSTNTLAVVNSTIAGNSASQYNAILEMSGTATIANSVITGNRSTTSDNIALNSGSLTLSNSTVAYNYTAVTASNASGAFYVFPSGALTIRNSILWGNRNGNNSADQIEGSAVPTVSNSIIEGGIFGGLNSDPMFATPIAVLSTPTTAGDVQLSSNSPAIDAGANANVVADSLDVNGNSNTSEDAPDRAGNPRRYNDTGVTDTGSGTAPIVDLGAYERQTNSDPCSSLSFPYTLPNNSPATLIQAIQCANANGTADVINLNGQTVTLTTSFGNFSGATGLPQITTPVTVRNGTITRSGSNEFRFFNVSNTGNLTVRDMTLTNGGGVAYANDGGTMMSQGSSSTLTVINTTISGSRIENLRNGSAIYSNAIFAIVNSSVVGGGFGRGAIASNNGPALIQNTLIAGNSGPTTINGAGGVYFGNMASATIENSTIVGNFTNITTATQPGGVFASGGTVNLTIRNSIIWGNRNIGNTAPQVVNATAGTNTVTNSIIEGGIFGALNSDPLFVTPIIASTTPTTAGNFQLSDSSPAIDAGANANVPVDTFDVNGNSNTSEDAPDRAGAPRRYNDTGVVDTGTGTAPIVDIGAYEKQTNSLPLQANVAITKTDGQTAAVPGTAVTYTIVVSNAGPAIANTVTVVDNFPGNVGSVTWTVVSGGGATCGANGGGNINRVVSLPIGASCTFTAGGTISPVASGSLVNTATATVGGGLIDPNGANNSATDTTTLLVLPSLSIGDVSRSEGFNGVSAYDFTVSLSSPALAGGVSFDISTANGTATAGSDYTARNFTSQTIPAGSSTYTLSVPVFGDAVQEADETFFVNLSNVSGAIVADGQGLGTILNDDTAGVSIVESGGSTSVAESGATDTYTVVLNSEPVADVNITLGGGSQLGLNPTTLLFTAGNWNTAQTVTVNAINDALVEGAHTGGVSMTVSSSDPGYNGLPVATVSVSITDNDSASVSFQSPISSAPEAVTPHTVNAVLNITANGTGTPQLQSAASVVITQTPGTATAADYTLSTSSINFPAAAADGMTRTISISIVDDAIAEADESFALGFGAVTGVVTASGSHEVSITDNDAPGITVTESAGSTAVAEGGMTDSYTVRLSSEPAAPVMLQLAFDPAQLIINGDTDGVLSAQLDSGNFSSGVSFNVVAVDDTLIEANPHSSAIVQTATSADAVYAAINPADVTVSITENDSQQISFVQVSSTVGEAAGTHVVQARLSLLSNGTPGGTISAEMSATVAATLGTAEASDFTLVTTSITFPAGAAHNSTLPINVGISNDRALEGDETLTLGLQLVGSLGSVSGTHEVTITDNESGAIGFIGPASNVAEGLGPLGVDTQLIVSGTGSGPFVVESAASVVIVQTPGTAASPVDYSVATSLISFPAGSISGATQSIISSIVDDRWVEGDETYALSFGAVSASGVVTASGTHAVTISDNDTASFGFAPGDDTVSEALGVFNKPVSLSISAIGTGTAGLQNGYALPVGFVEGTATEPEDFQLSSSTLNFAAGALDGASLQASAIIVDDVIAEIDESFQLNLSSAGAPSYIALGRSSTTVTIDDNDTPGVTINPGDGVTVTEGGATDSYTLVLNSQPTADVTLTLSGTQVTTSPTSVVFTALNWNVTQIVTVTAIDDAVAEGTHTGSVSTSSASADGNYQGIAVAQVSVSISDNDTAGITLTQSAGSTDVTEGGATDTYTAVLTSQPTADVTLSFSGTQVTTSPSSVVFTALNWNVAQTVTVTAIDDAVAEGNHSGSISTVVSGDDTTYTALSVANIGVNISDNDNAGVTLVQSNGSTEVTEGGATDSYTVQLSSEPTAAVTLNLSGTQVTTSPTTLNFSAANWDQPQTVTVTAIDDVIVEGPHSGSVSTTVVSSDGNYNGLSVTAVSVAITDNDVAGLSISDASIVEGNSGTSALVFTVTLNVAVPEAFTVGYSSTDGTAVAGSDYATASGTLSFVGNAGETQTLNVTINGDTVLEANESFTVNLGTPSSALVAVNDGQGSGSIENDDSASLSATPVIQAEGDSGTSTFSFVLQLSGQVQDGFTVRAVTRDDTAVAGSDYNAADVNVSFDGSLNPTRTVLIGVIGDVLPEARERFWLDLSSTQPGLVINPASVSGEIENDDLFADLSVSNTQLPGPLGKGSIVEFEVVVRNLSEVVDVPAAQFSMSLSETLDPLDWTCTAAVGATCPASGSGLPNHSIALDAGSSVTYRVRATVNTTTQPDDQVGSTATISISAPYSDPDSSNNSASAGGNVGTDRVFQNGFESVQ